MHPTAELPGAGYLYTMAILGMTFIGYSAVVMLLRQTLGRKLRAFDALFAHVYMEFGLIVSMGAMLPQMLMFWELSNSMIWRISSLLVGFPLLVFAVTYSARRKAASGETTPAYVWLNVTFVLLVSLTLLGASAGAAQERAGTVFITALTVFMIFAVATWLQALALVLAPKAR
jgi:hypothetical protein